jgi:hypothetical protein
MIKQELNESRERREYEKFKKLCEKQDITLGGWDSHKTVYFFKQKKFFRRAVKSILKSLGLNGLRFNWDFPRPATSFIKKQFQGKSVIGVEVGVQRAENARSMLENLNIKKLYLVDPYKYYIDVNLTNEEADYIFSKGSIVDPIKEKKFVSLACPNKENMDEVERIAKNTLKKFSSKTVFIKKTSDEAIKDIPDNIDFAYIDGDHTYEQVKKDLVNYYRKLKKGGYLCGHDAFYPNIGVQKAVFEFAAGKKFIHFGVDDWLILKS